MPRKSSRRPPVRHLTRRKRCAQGHAYETHGLVVKDGLLASGAQKWRLECQLCRRAYNREYFHTRRA